MSQNDIRVLIFVAINTIFLAIMSSSFMIILIFVLTFTKIQIESTSETLIFVSSLRLIINPLGTDLYNTKLCEQVDNCVFSPYSLTVLLTMLSTGSKGQTFQELMNLLKLSDDTYRDILNLVAQSIKLLNDDYDDYTLNLVNRIYTDENFPPNVDFQRVQRVVSELFQGVVSTQNFSQNSGFSQVQINYDVALNTTGKILDILPDNAISENTKMILISAVYFKAKWLVPFDNKLTVKADFFLTPQQKIQVPTMFTKGEFRFDVFDDALLVELPYAQKYQPFLKDRRNDQDSSDDEDSHDDQDTDLSLVLLLPSKNVQIENLNFSQFIDDSLNMISTSNKKQKILVELFLPKFDIEFNAGSLKQSLKLLGLKSTFDPEYAVSWWHAS
eukprot:TRINITY_DN9315_c2_g1_i3.p1 TRINITY_DN9315_c2_g1~~TRINITY_DN9315_c2_g1_i3.p1  ORF type:complete len:386 (+),score=43.52 TRINITY_DN9315_c2_g1_i3:293-1450(+)